MYSSEGGELLFHTKNQIIRFVIFFIMMLALSFVRIRFWYSISPLGSFVGTECLPARFCERRKYANVLRPKIKTTGGKSHNPIVNPDFGGLLSTTRP